MKFTILTLFPNIFEEVLNTSILKRAQNKKLVEFEVVNIRDFGEGIHQVVDGKTYGGGTGLVLKPDVLARALTSVLKPKELSRKGKFQISNFKFQIIMTSASGKPYNQNKAKELSKLDHIILICGHYEGVDQRFIDKFVDEEISIGDYVLTGGELPALVIIDSVTRLLKGVLKKEDATSIESFENNLLEYPQYTRPAEFMGEKVPEVLISGNHQEVDKWRKEQALEKTRKLRPDLLD